MAETATTVKVKDLKISRQSLSSRALFATWSILNKDSTNYKHQEKFEYEWLYYRDGIWFKEDSGDADKAGVPGETYVSISYEPPENASRVKIRVKPVSKTHTVEVEVEENGKKVKKKKEKPYFKAEWASYTFIYSKNRIPKQSVMYLAVSRESNVLTATWYDDYYDADEVSGYSYNWDYYNGRVWIEGAETGTATIPIWEGHVTRDGKTIYTYQFGCQYTIAEEAEVVRVTVTPVPRVEYLFIGEPESKDKSIKTTDRQVKNITLTVADNGQVEGLWQISDDTYVESFEYEYQNWANDMWNPSTSGTVPIESSAWGTGKKRSWGALYTPPEGSTAIRIRVRPVSSDEALSVYNDEWSSFIKLKFVTSEKKVDYIEAERLQDTARTYLVEWGLIDSTNVASFEYRIQYKTSSSNLWINSNSGTLDVVQVSGTKTKLVPVYSQPDPSGPITITEDNKKVSFWSITYDPPENATNFKVFVTCKPAYYHAFSPVTTTNNFAITVPTKAVDTIDIYFYDQSTSTLQSTVFMSDTTGVASYSATWEYWHEGEPGSGMWFPGKTETVPITTKGGRYGYGVSTYQIQEDTETIRVSMEPVPSVSGSFLGNPKTIKQSYKLPSIEIDKRNISVEIQRDTDRTMLGRWKSAGVPLEATENFEYQWRYKIGTDWFYESAETLPDIAQIVTNPYDAPETSNAVGFRIRPIPIGTFFYIPEWSDWVDYNFNIPTRSVNKNDISLSIQRGSERTIVCTWSMVNEDNVDSYSYRWRYEIDNIWYSGSTGSADVDTPSCTYDAPSLASTVEITIFPNPIYSTSFVGSWSTAKLFDVPDYDIPADGTTPSVSIEGNKLTATVDTYDEHASKVEFEVVTETSVFTSATIPVKLNRARYIVTLNNGSVYRVRSRGVNDDGEVGAWSQYSEDIFTAPNAPVITSVSAESSTSVTVVWSITGTASDQHIDHYTLEYVIDNSEYFTTNPSAVTSQDYPTTTATLIGLEPGHKYYFRVKANNGEDSEWSAVKSGILGTTPEAPTVWSSTTVATVDRDIYLYWVHNSEDQSIERAAAVTYRVDYGDWITEMVYNTSGEADYTGSFLLPGNTFTSGAKIQWCVRTKGVLEEYGPQSEIRSIDIYAAPTLSMTIKQGDDEALSNSTIRTFPIKLTFSAGPSTQTPISYYVSIIAQNSYEGFTDTGRSIYVPSGSTVYTKYISNTSRSFTHNIEASDVALESGYSYLIKTVLTMNSGLMAEASRLITVNWDIEEVLLNAELMYDPTTYTMQIRPYCEDEDGNQVANVTLGVYRREFDGSFTEIMSGVPNDNRRTVVVDPHPALDYARYRITALSRTSGRIFFYDLPGHPIGITSIVIQWDEQWQTYDYDPDIMDEPEERPYQGSIVVLPYNVDTDESNDLDTELVNYIGRKHPVSYYGTQLGQTATWNSEIPATDVDTVYALRRLSIWPGDAYVREPSGIGYWANVKVSFSRTHNSVLIPVSVSVTRVEGGT